MIRGTWIRLGITAAVVAGCLAFGEPGLAWLGGLMGLAVAAVFDRPRS